MIRRIISLTLIFALLANQSLLFSAHAHDGIEAGENSTRPHIHISGQSHHHGDHSHHHRDFGADHHHDHAHPSNDNSDSHDHSELAAESLESLDRQCHDQDAIYLSGQLDLGFSVGRISIVKPMTASVQWSIVVSMNCRAPIVARCGIFREFVPLGFYSAAHCAIFLQTARLLL